MASYRVAYGKAASVNGNEVYVDLRKMGTGSDATTEFDLGPDGYKITTDRPSEEHMLPGIITQTLEVVTVWDSIKLDPLLTALANSSDGDYLLELKTSLTAQPFMITVLLPESFTVSDDAGKVTVKFTGTDGLSLLKNTLYNDDGVAYTDHATLKQHIENVQEKMLTWTRVNDLGTANPTDLRLGLCMGATSVDDEDYSVFPPSNTAAGYQRMRVHHRTFHKRNTDASMNTILLTTY